MVAYEGKSLAASGSAFAFVAVKRLNARDVDRIAISGSLGDFIIACIQRDDHLSPGDQNQLRVAHIMGGPIRNVDADRAEWLLSKMGADFINSHVDNATT